MFDYVIKCICAFTNIFQYLSENMAQNREKLYLLLSGNGNPLITQTQMGNLTLVLLMQAGNWQTFLSYLLPHENITTPSEAKIVFNVLCIRPL